MMLLRNVATKAVLALLMISGFAGALRAGDARPSMPYTGTARMDSDGTITLQPAATADGKPAESGVLTYKVGDRGYDSVKRHIGLRPGDTKPFRPWKD
jgi:hypothetical protein